MWTWTPLLLSNVSKQESAEAQCLINVARYGEIKAECRATTSPAAPSLRATTKERLRFS